MFNFMKKTAVLGEAGVEERDGEKERRKREKKERKEREKRERVSAGMEEPQRLEEVRRSLKLRGRRKEKEKLPSGITADYTASLFAHLEQDSNYSNCPVIPTSGSNSNLSDENNHLSPSYPTTHTWSKREVLQSDSSETSLNSLNNPNNANTSPRQPPNLPPIPPRPPKRGILKGPRLSNTSSNSIDSNVHTTDTVDYVNGQDPNVLARNTQQNEVISYGMSGSKSTSSSDDMQHIQNFTKKVIHSPVENQYKGNYKNNANPTITTQDVDEAPKTNGNSYLGVTSTSPSADSLTDTTTNSSFATPPFSTSPIGESQGFHRWSKISNFEDVELPLPPLTPLQLPKPRVLTIPRQKAPRNDFGFSLRRAVIQDRVFIGDLKGQNGHEENGVSNGEKLNGNVSGLTSKLTYKAVVLAEPGSYPGSSETGLLPGDRLLEVNGVSVEGKSREEVIELIKGSQESVTVKVQPIAELCELSRRRAADGGGDVELAESNVRGGTLSRSGSRRFHSAQGSFAQSLRGGDEMSPGGNKTLAALAKIHKHCTGKAHANGCGDKHNPLAKSDSNSSLQSRKSNQCIIEIKEADKNHNFAKNDGSLTKSFSNSTSSYEGHSDTDSENTFKNRPDQKMADPCERLFAQNTKASLMKTARMRYADDGTISALQDEVDGEKKQAFNRTPLRSSYRERKTAVVTIEEVKSDGSNNDEELANALLFDEKKKPSTPSKNGVRKGSNGSVNGKTNGTNGTKPPWRGVSKKGIPPEPFVRTPSLRGSVRKKKNEGTPWRRLYELSLWRKIGVSFASVGADSERALLRPWREMSTFPEPPPTPAKSEELLACEQQWLQTGHMWLAHRGGYTAVVRDGDAGGGRLRVRVLQTGEQLVVDEDDLEKANPPQMERCEDIASLRCLTECGALHALRARHAAGLPHARAGHALLVLGPPKRTAPVYTEKVAAMFRGCRADDMPPHVFAAAQAAHRSMLAARRDRAVVFMGRSGSGKTTAMRHCVWYLASAYPAQGTRLTPERLGAAFDVLHTFGSARTGSNPHASRYVSLASLDFDAGGALAGASVQALLPALRPAAAPLAALHLLFHGCDGRLRRELLLDQAPISAPNPYITSSEKAEAPAEFSALKDALHLLTVTEQEQMAVWRVLAAICHLGWAGVAKGPTGKYQFGSGACSGRAATLLGLAPEELARAALPSSIASPQTQHAQNTLRTPSPSSDKEMSGADSLEAFVHGLYNETFNIVAALVNRSLSSSARTSASILLLDSPGADNPLCAGQQNGAPLEQLLSNYLQERLQALFHEASLVSPRERYAQEGIALDGDEEDWAMEGATPGPMVELLDRAPQTAIVRSSQPDLRDADRRGLLWLLDEESMFPGAMDESFLERALSSLGGAGQPLLRRAPLPRQFVLMHAQGTNPVLYDVTGWVKASRENPVMKKALTVLQESQIPEVSRLAVWARGAGGAGAGAWAGCAGADAATLRRASSIRRTLTSGTAGMKRRSIALQAKFAADGVVDSVRRCGAGGAQFVCCLQAAKAGDAAGELNVPLLRSQFRGFQLLEAARLYKQGFPEHMPLSEFARRYRLLATSEADTAEPSQQTAPISDRQVVDDMLLDLDLDVTSYRLGLTQIMFRGGVVGALDARRDAALARVLVRLQARARGLLARRRALRLRTQHTAARCVQRNVRAFLAVRDWPWWRLLVRVTPLLAVHRTEHRLKQAQEELETLRGKLEKVETERTHYKNETEKLENKLSEVGGELSEERAAAAHAAERADAEAAERLRVERDNRDLVTNNQRLQQASERLELELLHWRSADSGGAEPSDSEGSEAEAGGEKYKRRFERAHRELQLLRAQLRRQHEDDLEQLVMVKKQLEKKVQDAYEEAEEQRAVAAQWKRKLQKLTNDMADLRSLLDEQTCRNNLLEKRQRKFDVELHSAQEELKRERTARDRLARDRDQALADKYALEQSLQESRLELELKEERLTAAARELEQCGGGGDEAAALRKARADLERRVRDQEEELDDLAGQIQLLESAKVRLEMLLEQQRKEARLEAAARDDELEETRANAVKKLKMLESQLESEHAERSLLVRERHELERRLASLEEAARNETTQQAHLVQRLKRDLKRYRALLRDAQTMLEQKEKEGGGKAQIRQLKNQVEDLELSVRAACKAKASAEAEAAEAVSALEEAARARDAAAERALAAGRDAAAARTQLDDAEEEAAELLKKYRTCTSALNAAQAEGRAQAAKADQASEEARQARERLQELAARLARAEAGHSHGQAEAERRLEVRNKELESSLELEATARSRLEGQASRLREAHDQLAAELAAARQRDQHHADEMRKMARQLRELKEETVTLSAKLGEATRARAAAEAAAAAAAAEAAAARDEARLAARRATALQEAIAGDLSSPGDSRDTDSDDSYSSDESIGTFLANHKLSPHAHDPHNSRHDSQKSQSPEGRLSRSSAGSAKRSSLAESTA